MKQTQQRAAFGVNPPVCAQLPVVIRVKLRIRFETLCFEFRCEQRGYHEKSLSSFGGERDLCVYLYKQIVSKKFAIAASRNVG